VNHKEGIDLIPRVWKKFVEFLVASWAGMSDVEKLMCDLILVKSKMQPDAFDAMMKEQDRIYAKLVLLGINHNNSHTAQIME